MNPYSLSHYFDEMNKKHGRARGYAKQGPESLFFTKGLELLKTLEISENYETRLLELSRSAKMKIGECQEIVDQLRKESLVDVEPDESSGNDLVRITQKGKALL